MFVTHRKEHLVFSLLAPMIPPPSTQLYDGRWRQGVGSPRHRDLRADDVYCHRRARTRFKYVTIADSKPSTWSLNCGRQKNRPGRCRMSQRYRATPVSAQRALMVTGTDRRSMATFGALRSARSAAIATAAMALAACGGSGNSATQSTAPLQVQNIQLSQAAASGVQVTASQPGITPFISFVELIGTGMQNVAGAGVTIEPRSGSVSKPVHVRYAINALVRRGYLLRLDSAGQWLVRLPVFGLYAGYANQVLVRLDFQDGSVADLSAGIATAAYHDPSAIYDQPTIFKKRGAGTVLGFDFFVMKSWLGSPVVIDTDGEIRWVGAGISNASSSVVE